MTAAVKGKVRSYQSINQPKQAYASRRNHSLMMTDIRHCACRHAKRQTARCFVYIHSLVRLVILYVRVRVRLVGCFAVFIRHTDVTRAFLNNFANLAEVCALLSAILYLLLNYSSVCSKVTIINQLGISRPGVKPV